MIYEKATCTTCKNTVELLKQHGVEFEELDFFIDELSAAKIAELLDKMAITPRELLRSRATQYSELGLEDSDHSDVELIDLMAEHPDLVQRPIAELGPRAVLCRPYERVLELLS